MVKKAYIADLLSKLLASERTLFVTWAHKQRCNLRAADSAANWQQRSCHRVEEHCSHVISLERESEEKLRREEG